jgi:hemerythrin superfamily protein
LSVDAIKLLKDDHKTVKELFKRFDQAGPRALKTKRNVVDQIIRELAIHSAIEEELFYPTARERVERADDVVLESLEEHHVVKLVLSELERMDPRDERFDPKVTVLKENVLHHAQEEEQGLFPKVRKALKPAELRALGDRMAEAKGRVPTRPHPRAPDEPPGNVVASPMAAVMDAVKDAIKGIRKEMAR